LLIIIESLFDVKKKTNFYRFNDAIGSLATGMLNRTMNFITLYANWAAYSALFAYFGFQSLTESVLVWIAAFIIYDFFYYWSHRLAHVYSLFWNSHAVHHQSEEFNLTTALRQPFTGFVKGSIVYLPMVFMGFDPTIVATVGSLNLIYQFWVHTRFIPKLGFIEFVFVTPSNHRVHHGMNDCYIDKNFGGVFIIWDRLFKTFEYEQEPVIFGVRKQLNSFNPFYANIQIFWNMFNDIWLGKSVKIAFKILISRTGRRPEALAIKHPVERLNLKTYKRYDPVSNLSLRPIIWTQLVFSMAYTVWFLLFIRSEPFANALLHFLPLGLALLSMTWLLEARKIGLWCEAVKLFYLVFACIYLPNTWNENLIYGYSLIATVVLFLSLITIKKEVISEA